MIAIAFIAWAFDVLVYSCMDYAVCYFTLTSLKGSQGGLQIE